jgi:hypothetical protein
MYKCKYCGALANNPKQVKNNFYFECESCGKKSTFYTDLFDVVDDKGEKITDKDKANSDKPNSDFEYWWRGYYKK